MISGFRNVKKFEPDAIVLKMTLVVDLPAAWRIDINIGRELLANFNDPVGSSECSLMKHTATGNDLGAEA